MRTTALAIMACLLGTAAGRAPDTLWVRTLDTGVDELGNGIASRGSAIVVAGNAMEIPLYSDVLVVRFNQSGDTVWTRTYDGGGDEFAIGACLDAQSSALAVGYGDPGMPHSEGLRFGHYLRPWDKSAKDQLTYALIAKYDSTGELKWLKTYPGYQAFGIVADSAGDYYVTGGHIVSDTTYDLWLAKLNPSGDTVWSRTYDFAPLEIGYRVALDASGNIATCAYAGDFGNFDCLTVKLTPNGDTIWSRRHDRGTDDGGFGLAIDPAGNVIVAGKTGTDATGDVLVLKYAPSGVPVWFKRFDFDVDDGGSGVACDSVGNIYVAGHTGADYVYDCLTMKLDPMGDTLWTATYGGPGDDAAADVACDGAGDPIISGWAFNPISGNVDLLVAKYSALTGVAESPHADPNRASARGTITAAPDFVLAVPSPGHYDIRLCDLTGRTRQQVFCGHLSEGAHRFSLVGQPSGRYFVRVAAPDGGISCQKLVLVK